mgnify:FL=1
MRTKNSMAQRKDIRENTRQIDPRMAAMVEAIEKAFRKHGLTPGVTLTEDMTPEEEDMALFEGYLKGGYSEDIASKKAKERLALINWVFDNKGTGDIKK